MVMARSSRAFSPTITEAFSETLLQPHSEAELSALVRDLHGSGRPWTPAGLGSRLHWGPPLQQAGPAVSTRRFNRIIDHAVDDLTITVEAGLPLADLQNALAEHHQWLPVDWPWGTATELGTSAGTVGGLVARGLSGSLRQRHLGVRDQLIGIGLMRSDGVAAKAGGRVVKNVAGYDLMRLLCGSWGSLALITEVTLRVQPIRRARRLLLVRGEPSGLEPLRQAVIRGGFTPDWINWETTPDPGCTLRLGVASISDAAVDAQLSQIEALADDLRLKTERQAWSHPLPAPIPQASDPAWLLRLSLPPARGIDLLNDETVQRLQGWSCQLAAGTGSGDAWQAQGPATPTYAIAALRRQVVGLGGEVTVLTQPSEPENKQALDAWLDAPSRPLIEAVKRQFDPRLQLARGRLPGVAAPFS